MISCWACLKETGTTPKDSHGQSQSRSLSSDTMFEECFKMRPLVSTPLCSDCDRILLTAHKFYHLCKKSCEVIKHYLDRERNWDGSSYRWSPSLAAPSSPLDTKDVVVKEETEAETSTKSHECSICFKMFRTWVALAKHVKRTHENPEKFDRLLTSHAEVSLTRLSFKDWETADCDPGKGYFDDRNSPSVSIKEEPADDIFDNITVDDNLLTAIKSDEEEKPLISYKLDVPKAKRKVGRPKKVKNFEPVLDLNEQQFSCLTCAKTFSSERNLKVHSKRHELYPCTICGETFPKSSHLKKHVLANHGSLTNLKNLCEACGEEHSTPEELQKHECCPEIKKPFSCDLCNCRFSHQSLLERHIVYHSGNDKGKKVAFCPVCGKGFTTVKYLETHARMHNGDTTFSCKICSKVFNSKCHLREHTKWHSTERPFLCSECGKRFVRNDYLIIHMRRHRGEKPYKCKYCNKGFPRSTDLNVHERYHTGEKAHLCTVCGKGFQRHYNLTIHLRVHTGEKPYVCSYCGKCFAQGNDLKSHVRRHTGERYNCELCGEGFIQGYHLTQHKRSAHGIESNSFSGRLNKIGPGESQIVKQKKKCVPDSQGALLLKQDEKISTCEITDDRSTLEEKSSSKVPALNQHVNILQSRSNTQHSTARGKNNEMKLKKLI